jgi:alkylhydroperoxidase family enzyme
MRIPYAPSTPPEDSNDQSTVDIYTRIAARRHPRPLIPLDLALLHSPAVADGWNSFLGAIRSRTIIDQGLLELAVCRVAVLNDAVYEWNAHAPLALKAGVMPEQLKEAKRLPPAFFSPGQGDGAAMSKAQDSALTIQQWTVLAYTDQMTRSVKVEDGLFERLLSSSSPSAGSNSKEDNEEQQGANASAGTCTGAGLSHREVVELTTAIAAYNCVSRFLVALDVGENNDREMKSVDELVEILSRT